MGLIRDAMGKPRWAGGGLFLLLVLVVLLAAPLLRHGRGLQHPLAGSQRMDLCPYLSRAPAPFAGAAHAPQPDAPYTATCEFIAPDGRVGLRASLTSTRQLSAQGAARTSKLYESWKKETAVSTGAVLRDLPGTWTSAFAYRDGERNLVVTEDQGVFLVFESRVLDAPALEAWAAEVALALREAPKDSPDLDHHEPHEPHEPH